VNARCSAIAQCQWLLRDSAAATPRRSTWGSLPYISEFSSSGRLLFSAELPAGVSSYRAYPLPWHPAG
jgi:hypothetical protein